MDPGRTRQFDLGDGLNFATEPGDQGKGDELEVREVTGCERPVYLSLISGHDPLCDESHGIFRRTEGYLVEHFFWMASVMHTVVIRHDLLTQLPELSQSIYKGFCDAKESAVEKYKQGLIFNSMRTMFPWFSQLVEEDVEVLGEDWWPYGITANRKSIDAVLRFHHEQGITDRLFSVEDIFVPELLAI